MSATRIVPVLAAALLWCLTLGVAAETANKGNFTKSCSDNWKFAKAHDTIPSTITRNEFVKVHCSPYDEQSPTASKMPPTGKHTAKGAGPAKAHVIPAMPSDHDTMKPAADWTKIPVATVDKHGKPLTPGQIAALRRIKQCGAEWRADRDAGKLAPGETWQQYWPSCKARLKSTPG